MRGKPAHELTESEVRDIALRYLARREYAVEELRHKITARGAEPAIVGSVINALVEENLLSDERFTEMYVRMRIRALFGPLKIRAELRGRGVPGAVIDQFWPADEETWFESASQWAARKHTGELDYATKGKIYRSLMNRGFTHEQANVALDNCARPDSSD
ncbi:MAG: regulatory protein RecX [Lysobacterales bacterium]